MNIQDFASICLARPSCYFSIAMANTSPQSSRFGFIDALRGWAVIVMIEVHTFNEWLRPELKNTLLFDVLTFINGLVAPSFIMLAGFSLSIATVRKWEDYTSFSPTLGKRMRHLLLIFTVGYLLHLPAQNLRMWWTEPNPELVAKFQAVDVLQLIVMGLWILHAIVLLLKSRKVLFVTSLALGILVIAWTPWAYNTTTFEDWPLWLSNWFNRSHGSLFPLFPWVAYIFLGCTLALKFVEAQKQGEMSRFLHRMGAAGAALIVIGYAWHSIPITVQPYYEFTRTSPQFNLIRIGSVMVLIWALWMLEERRNISPRFAVTMGRESFLVYALHLMVLYNEAFGSNLVTAFKGALNFGEAFIGYMLLLLMMLATGYFWQWLKRRNMVVARVMMISLFTIGALFFVFFENGRFVFWMFE